MPARHLIQILVRQGRRLVRLGWNGRIFGIQLLPLFFLHGPSRSPFESSPANAVVHPGREKVSWNFADSIHSKVGHSVGPRCDKCTIVNASIRLVPTPAKSVTNDSANATHRRKKLSGFALGEADCFHSACLNTPTGSFPVKLISLLKWGAR